MSGALAWLDELPTSEAEQAFRRCCGSIRWARAMAAGRPFANEAGVIAAAESAWAALRPADWLEAAGDHPRLGHDAPPGGTPPPNGWSQSEQAGVTSAESAVEVALAAGQRAYEERFGYIFLISAAGKSGREILTALTRRLDNDPDIELDVMARELRQIVQLRVRKLCAEGGA
ncbi:MAG: 2-oxo-4-hydroxy-4-carboxy-5-ureidoimidazoline decarboxylase [Gemmatimonadota bacterium]